MEYSLFNAVIWIRKHEFSIRGLLFTLGNILPDKIGYYLLLTSGVLMLVLLLAERWGTLRRFTKVLWVFRALTVYSLLIFSELALRAWLTERVDRYYLSLTSLTFDVLWWSASGVLLNLAIEKFIWRSLEKRVNHTVPNLARLMVAAVVYLLVFFGIVAFVWNSLKC